MTINLTTRNLLISLCSHMAYMQGQLEALHQLDDPDGHYWYRESVALRQKVADHLAALADEPAVPQDREPAAVTGQLSDEELLNLAQQYSVVYLLSDGSACHPFQEGYDMRNDVLNFARAVLARWGHPAPPPADGEVAELVKELRRICFDVAPCDDDIITRAADLLERLSPPQPVPVSERLPGPEDMTDDGEVWIEDPGREYPLADAGDYDWEPHKWILRPIGKFDAQNGLRWLPAHALPQPEVGE